MFYRPLHKLYPVPYIRKVTCLLSFHKENYKIVQILQDEISRKIRSANSGTADWPCLENVSYAKHSLILRLIF
jgi:hypothetical protein